jgi:hypothetical protein
VEHPFVVPVVLVAIGAPLFAGNDYDEWDLARREDAPLPLQACPAVPFKVELGAGIDTPWFEHWRHSRRPWPERPLARGYGVA